MSIVKLVILFCCLTYLSSLPIDSDENSEQRRRINQDEEVPLGPANAMASIPPIWIIPFSGNPGNETIFSPPPLVAAYQRQHPVQDNTELPPPWWPPEIPSWIPGK